MKICMLVSNYLPRQGGAEYAVHHLTNVLIKLGHDVCVLMENDPAAKNITYPYPVYPCWRLPFVPSETKRWLHSYFQHRRQRFDVVHAHIAWPGAGLIGRKLKRKSKVAFVVTPHGGDVQVVPEIQYGMCLDPATAEGIRATLLAAELVTAVSKRIRIAIADRGGDPNRIRDAPYGTEFEKIQQLQTGDLRTQLGLSPDDFVTLSVGRNSRVKDIPTLVESLRIAAASEPRLKCIMVGPDESIRELVKQAGLTDRVAILGRIPSGYDPRKPSNVVFETPYPELIAAYRACDVFVATSYTESYNTSALDAFSCGKPAVITNTQGFMDTLEDGVSGYSVPVRNPAAFAEKLLWLARNRDRCRQMGEAARKVAAQYEWEKVAKRYLAVYEEAVRLAA